MSNLDKFYHDWSNRPDDERDFDIQTCVEKSTAALKTLGTVDIGPVRSVLEVGCGYGRNLFEIVQATGASVGIGCDLSPGTIEYAREHYGGPSISYFQTSSLDVKTTVAEIRDRRRDPFDLLVLFDVLEHVPRPRAMVRELAPLTKYFLIKLPLENAIFDNYLLSRKKTYPSAAHPDGHLREFHVNDVHAFVVSLGLTPLAYDFYKYRHSLLFPRHLRPRTAVARLVFEVQRIVKCVARLVLTKRIYLRLIGGGGFVCIATWTADTVLE